MNTSTTSAAHITKSASQTKNSTTPPATPAAPTKTSSITSTTYPSMSPPTPPTTTSHSSLPRVLPPATSIAMFLPAHLTTRALPSAIPLPFVPSNWIPRPHISCPARSGTNCTHRRETAPRGPRGRTTAQRALRRV